LVSHDRTWRAGYSRQVRSDEEGQVVWFVLGHFVAFLVDLALGTRPGDRDKDLQILVLRLCWPVRLSEARV
jgi:hypothetical protein